MSYLRVGNVQNVGATKTATSDSVIDSASRAFADFSVKGGDITSPTTVAANNSTTLVPLTRSNYASGITLNTSTYLWTHSQIGYYKITLSYRQDSGGDVWIQYAVKDATAGTVTGTSVRCGSQNSGHPAVYSFVYQVTSTSNSYGIYGWANGTVTARHSNYDGVASAWSSTTGDGIKVLIERVS